MESSSFVQGNSTITYC